MGDPNLDLGLDYTGGIAKPGKDQVGYTAQVALDETGDPNLVYVPGVERRVYYTETPPTLVGGVVGTTKSLIMATYKIPANFLTNSTKRLRIVVGGEWPARSGTKVGIDLHDGATATQMSLDAVATTPIASAPFIYEVHLFPSTASAQRYRSELRTHAVALTINSALTSFDMTVDQTVQITGQLANAADSMQLRRIEVFVLT
jgi:hypothetical protein